MKGMSTTNFGLHRFRNQAPATRGEMSVTNFGLHRFAKPVSCKPTTDPSAFTPIIGGWGGRFGEGVALSEAKRRG